MDTSPTLRISGALIRTVARRHIFLRTHILSRQLCMLIPCANHKCVRGKLQISKQIMIITYDNENRNFHVKSQVASS